MNGRLRDYVQQRLSGEVRDPDGAAIGPDQHLVLYSAPPGSRDAEALALLNVLGAQSFNAGGRA